MIAGHRYSSFIPQRPSQDGQRILKTGVRIGDVARQDWSLNFLAAFLRLMSATRGRLFFGQSVNRCIVSYMSGQKNNGLISANPIGIIVIDVHGKRLLWKPPHKHLLNHVVQCRCLFAVQPFIDMQAQFLVTSKWGSPQYKNRNIQSPLVDCPVGRRRFGIAPLLYDIDLLAGLMEDGIVQVQSGRTCWIKRTDRMLGRSLPEVERLPVGFAKQFVENIAPPSADRIGKGQDTCYGSPTGKRNAAFTGLTKSEVTTCVKTKNCDIACRCKKWPHKVIDTLFRQAFVIYGSFRRSTKN